MWLCSKRKGLKGGGIQLVSTSGILFDTTALSVSDNLIMSSIIKPLMDYRRMVSFRRRHPCFSFRHTRNLSTTDAPLNTGEKRSGTYGSLSNVLPPYFFSCIICFCDTIHQPTLFVKLSRIIV